jgi:hypothetical protein
LDPAPFSDERLARALNTLWRAAGVRGCYGSREREPRDLETVPCTVESLERFGHLRGVVGLPGSVPVVCGAVAIREEEGPDWLDFYLPLPRGFGYLLPGSGGLRYLPAIRAPDMLMSANRSMPYGGCIANA